MIRTTVAGFYLALVLCAAGCSSTTVGSLTILSRPTTFNVAGSGTFDVVASCPSAEQLIGGDLALPDPAGNGSGGNPLLVLASYPDPVAPNSWRLTFYAPANSLSQTQGSIVWVNAYCVTSQNLPLALKVVTATQTVPDFTSLASVDVQCPTGAVLASGGFKATLTPGSEVNNAGVLVSAPLASSGSPHGWHVGVTTTISGGPVQVSSYALCASAHLVGGAPISASSGNTAGSINEAAVANCTGGDLASGGGFGLAGDPLMSKHVWLSSAGTNYASWRSSAYVIQSGGNITASVVCVHAV